MCGKWQGGTKISTRSVRQVVQPGNPGLRTWARMWLKKASRARRLSDNPGVERGGRKEAGAGTESSSWISRSPSSRSHHSRVGMIRLLNAQLAPSVPLSSLSSHPPELVIPHPPQMPSEHGIGISLRPGGGLSSAGSETPKPTKTSNERPNSIQKPSKQQPATYIQQCEVVPSLPHLGHPYLAPTCTPM